jgi:hypothetical protein
MGSPAQQAWQRFRDTLQQQREELLGRATDPKLLGPPLLARLAATMDQVAAWRAAPRTRRSRSSTCTTRTWSPTPSAKPSASMRPFGLELGAEARERMARFLDVNRHGQGPAHRYGLADFGLDEAAIEATCGRYIDHYGVAREARA